MSTTTAAAAKPRRPAPCRCGAYKWPHRPHGGACRGPAASVPDALCSLPGRSHFATDREYLYESTRPL